MTRRFVACIATIMCFSSYLVAEEDDDSSEIEELVVSARATVAVDHLAELTATVIDRESIDSVQAIHPNELMSQVPGVWISRGSGQEHLTAIRSGVLTGAGACGAYLLLENGIPIRPASFCNVNGMFELNTEQASAIEVIRGPASSRYGGNALHGMINTITLLQDVENSLALQVGESAFNQVRIRLGNDLAQISAHATSTDGWRDDTGFDQQKLTGQIEQVAGSWSVTHTLALTSLAQETGGYVVGLDAYKNDALRFSNPNPEAFRDASSLRYASHWRNGNIVISPYVRHSSMDFLMHFLPGQPLERNAQRSAGVLMHWQREADRFMYSIGMQAEAVRAELSEIQDDPTVGSDFLVATRPMGTHYDFSVNASHVGLFHDGRWQFSPAMAWKYRVRLESASYDYDNLHLDGNTRDDGTACGFGGCLYTRPADRTDDFLDYSMQLGFERAMSAHTMLHGVLGTGFRPPQIAELYRLQSGQQFADIDSERLDAFELGLRRATKRTSLQVALYSERSKNLIIRDAEGFNQSGGRVNSSGIELRAVYSLGQKHTVRSVHSLARHQYDFTQDLARREVITAGNDVDTAPRYLGSLQWRFQINDDTSSTLELTRIGTYFLDAANTMEYPGHAIFHWHGQWHLTDQWELRAHIRNLLDEKYADRADLSFGNVRYFPAMPRNVQIGVKRVF